MMNQSKITALVINLANAPKRWQFQQQQLSRLDIIHERFEATTVADLTNAEYEKWANDWQRKLRKTEVACFLSHYRVWQHTVSTDQALLVLEDDALLSNQLPAALTLLAKQNTFQYDHLTFETRGRKKLIATDSFYNSENLSLHNLFLDKTGAAAYLLTPIGAQKLLDEVAKKGAGLADALLCHTRTLKKIQSVPALAIQMDMAGHYGMPSLELSSVAKSSISTNSNAKPTADNLASKLQFKSKRLATQIDMGLIQAKYARQSEYLEVLPNQRDFSYIKSILDSKAPLNEY